MSRKSAVASGFSHKVLVWSVARSAIVRQEDRCFLGTEQVELGGGGAGAVKVFGSLTLRAPMVSFPFVRQDDFAQLDSRGTMQVKSVDWSANFMDVSFEISPQIKKMAFRWRGGWWILAEWRRLCWRRGSRVLSYAAAGRAGAGWPFGRRRIVSRFRIRL